MSTIQTVFGVIHLIVCVFLIAVIILQSGKSAGLSGSIGGGGGDSFYEKNRGNTNEAKLERLTKIAAVLFVIITVALNFVF